MEVLVIHNNGINESHVLCFKYINVFFEEKMVSEQHSFILIKPKPCHTHRLFSFEDNMLPAIFSSLCIKIYTLNLAPLEESPCSV